MPLGTAKGSVSNGVRDRIAKVVAFGSLANFSGGMAGLVDISGAGVEAFRDSGGGGVEGWSPASASIVVTNAMSTIAPPTISRRDLRPNGPSPHARTEETIERSRDDDDKESSGSARRKRPCTYSLLTGRTAVPSSIRK
jgi:hypothetical protein